MKVIIIEDEPLSAEHLVNLLKKIGGEIEIVAQYDSVKQSLKGFEKGINAELMFVDIHLADGLSFEIFEKVSIEIPVIFTTAFDEYAIKAFKVNSIDYLLKPIGREDLQLALEKYKRLNKEKYDRLIKDLSAHYQISESKKSRFMVRLGDNISSIKTEEVAYFVSEDGSVLLCSNAGKRFVIDYTVEQLESILDPKVFFRINRKVIINYSSIEKVGSYFNSRLKIASPFLDEESSIVSRERVGDFKLWLDQ